MLWKGTWWQPNVLSSSAAAGTVISPSRRPTCSCRSCATNGYEVQIEESPAVYADAAAMAATDLIVQCVTMSTIERDQVAGLRAAVEAGTGFTGWHGGIADSYRDSADYLQLVGGQFATHPGKHPDELRRRAERQLPRLHGRDHRRSGASTRSPRASTTSRSRPSSTGCCSDDLNDVLATTTHPVRPWHPWHRPITSPAIWTRQWGAGRIVVTTPGHSVDVLENPTVRTVIERGMLWATRRA